MSLETEAEARGRREKGGGQVASSAHVSRGCQPGPTSRVVPRSDDKRRVHEKKIFMKASARNWDKGEGGINSGHKTREDLPAVGASTSLTDAEQLHESGATRGGGDCLRKRVGELMMLFRRK